MGGGLGGGSSNGTYLLKIVDDLLSLNLSTELLHDLAASLGSDCAFFIKNEPQLATGRGDQLITLSVSLKDKYLLLVNDGTHISTQEAYNGIDPTPAEQNWSSILHLPVYKWKDQLKNDFEKSAFQLHPQLKDLKNKMYEMGAEYASMTGSGSTMYGIFSTLPVIEHLKVNGFVEVVKL
jgi:4-diphosphocytidyl-2-C-methyl-D-erythritol kinase